MQHLICKHLVADFAQWRKVFDSHAHARREAGFQLVHLMRDVDNPDMVVMWYRVEDVEKAKAFMSAPAAARAAAESGVVSPPEIYFLHE